MNSSNTGFKRWAERFSDDWRGEQSGFTRSAGLLGALAPSTARSSATRGRAATPAARHIADSHIGVLGDRTASIVDRTQTLINDLAATLRNRLGDIPRRSEQMF